LITTTDKLSFAIIFGPCECNLVVSSARAAGSEVRWQEGRRVGEQKGREVRGHEENMEDRG
jgi:hypothetical protein